MSLSRLALRLAALEALCPSALAESGPWPTAAGAQVYDSVITPISDATAYADYIAQNEGKPVVTVYTEEQETSAAAGEYPADVEIVDLVVEILIAARGVLEVTGPDGEAQEIGTLTSALTSTQHEAMLDLIEQQVRSRLDPDSAACPEPYVRIARELHHVKSAPVRDAVGRLSRLAARTVTFKLRVARTQAVGVAAEGVDAALALLPEPLLTLALSVPAQSASGQLLRQIAANLAAAVAPVSLDEIRVYANADRDRAPAEGDSDLVGCVSL